MISEKTPLHRNALRSDFHRPRYHFLPPTNWMNDPNGLIQWNGTYHLFYQHNPYGPLWGNMSWGHASSPDLIHWTDLPIAIEPTPGSADQAGVFSGCAVNHDGVPTIFYTSTAGERSEIQTQSIATSDDQLLTWEKHPANPIIRDVPAELGQNRDFRDPFVWKAGDQWYMVLGSRSGDATGVVLLYRSSNLLDWEYLNPILTSTEKRHGAIWECPNFFQLGEKWVLIISAHAGHMTDTVYYFVGDFVDHRFIPQYEAVLDYGTLYAPLTFVNEQGQRLLMGWLRESRSDADQRVAGWSGVQSIPRLLSLDEHNRLIMTPIAALDQLRGRHHRFADFALNGETPLPVSGMHLDIMAEFQIKAGGRCGLTLGLLQETGEHTEIVYDQQTAQLSVHKIYRESNGALTTSVRSVPHALSVGETLRLRILLDASVVELIANDRTSLTSRIYPASDQSTAISVSGHQATVRSIDIWEMPSIWQ